MGHYSQDDGDAETQNVAILGILGGTPTIADVDNDGAVGVLFVCDSHLHCVDFGSGNG